MRIAFKLGFSQLFILLALSALCSCGSKKAEIPVIPPVTSPLSRDYIGFGVITASFTHIAADPSEVSDYRGYLRRGSLVRIIRRQTVKTANGFVSWVLIDDSEHGWLREEVMNIYDNESQAKTASELILK
jgi:hypothetical protein